MTKQMSRLMFLVLIGAAALVAGCGENPTRPEVGHSHAAGTYTVQRGDTLYSIAFRHGTDVRHLAEANNIPPPYRIYPGQSLKLGANGNGGSDKDLSTSADNLAPVWVEGKPASAQPVARVERMPEDRPFNYAPTPSPAEPKAADREPAQVAKAHHETDLPPLKSNFPWRWPTEGKVIQTFSPGNDKKGIDIRGSDGQAVVAAAPGDVVYSGSGLLGYGNLLIIKHDESFLSAYGHNRNLLVKQGDRVKAGQKIAEMGQTPKDGSILHFEIRRDGKPVDPLRYLPK